MVEPNLEDTLEAGDVKDEPLSTPPIATDRPKWIQPVRKPDAARMSELIEQALDLFDIYNTPAIREFLRRQDGLHVGGPRPDLISRIRKALTDGNVSPVNLFNYLDELKENGYQYIFLFKLRAECKPLLKKLASESYLIEQLKNYGLDDRFTEPPLIWQSRLPQLAAVAYEPKSGPPEFLKFRWVETRFWREQIRKGPAYLRITRRERAVNFLRVNLKTGDAEIRLQMLRTRPRKSLHEELALYREQLTDLIDFDSFKPVLLESVVRGLLTSRSLIIKEWKVRFREGGIGGDYPPRIIDKFGAKVIPSVGVFVVGDWLIKGDEAKPPGKSKAKETRVNAKVDGMNDRVKIPDPAPAVAINKVLGLVRQQHDQVIEIAELKQTAEDHNDLSAALGKLDGRLRDSKKGPVVDLDRFAETEWAASDEVFRAAQVLADEHPDRFSIKYYVVCPSSRSRRLARNQEGAIHEYGDLKSVPPSISCKHQRGKIDHHPTKGNLKRGLVANLPEIVSLKTVWSEMLRYLIEGKFPGRMAKRFIEAIFVLVFSALYLLLLFIVGRKFLTLIEGDTIHQTLAVGVFIVGVVLVTALIIKLVGRKIFADAARSFREILSFASTVVQGKPNGSKEDTKKNQPVKKTS